MTTHVYTGEYVFSSNITSGTWTITPEIPDGLHFSGKHVWSGTPLASLPRQQFNLTVTTSGGSRTFLFFVEVNDCKEKFYLIRHAHSTLSADIFLRRGDVVIDNASVMLTSDDRWFCLSPGELTLFVNCTQSYGTCVINYSSDNNITFVNMILPAKTTKEITFSMIAREAPTMTIKPSELVLHEDQSVTLDVLFTDIYSIPLFEPALPSFMTYDRYLNTLKISSAVKGQYLITATVSNELGSGSSRLQLYVDKCSEDKQLLRFYVAKSGVDLVSIQDMDEQPIEVFNITTSHFRKSLCVIPGSYQITLHSKPETASFSADSKTDLLLLEEEEDIAYESFPTVLKQSSQVERFMVGDLIPLKSTMRFLSAASVDRRWTAVLFNDKRWEEKRAGEWGSFDPTHRTVFFRSRFTVSQPSKYALLLLEMHLRNHAEVYLNGQLIRTYSQLVEEPGQNSTSTRMIASTSCLQKGTNILAIKLQARFSSESSLGWMAMEEEEEIIQFDLRLHLSTSMCLRPDIHGVAFDDQKDPDPSYPPSQAFGDNYSWWKGKQLPVNLHFLPDNDLFMQPSFMRIATSSYEDSTPTSFRVYGQVIDHSSNHSIVVEEEEIGAVNQASFLFKRDYELVPLQASKPFNGFRIEFLDTYNHTIVRAGYIVFFPCQDAMCPKRLGWETTRVGSTTAGRCPFGTYGQNHRTCSREDVEPAWEEDRSMCLAKHSEKGFAFVDTGFHLEWVRDTMMESVGKKAKEFVVSSLTVWEDQISFPYIVMHEKDTVSLDIIMRFTVEHDIGSYVHRKMNLFKGNFTDKMRAYLQNVQTGADIQLTSDPVLRVPIPWTTIITILVTLVSVIAAFVLGIVCMYIYTRAGDGSGSNASKRKQLQSRRNGGKSKPGSLLDDME